MTHRLRRRLFCAGLGALITSVALHADAEDEPGLDGTWGGAQGNISAQVIVADATVLGFFWRNDYIDARDSKLSADGHSLTFTFQGGDATLTRTGERAASLDVSEGGDIVRLTLQRD